MQKDITMLDKEKVAQLQQNLTYEKSAVRLTLKDAFYRLTGEDISGVPTAQLIKRCRKNSNEINDIGLRLEKIDAALCAIHTHLYSLCADCEEDIASLDLEEDPAEPRCKACREQSPYQHAQTP